MVLKHWSLLPAPYQWLRLLAASCYFIRNQRKEEAASLKKSTLILPPSPFINWVLTFLSFVGTGRYIYCQLFIWAIVWKLLRWFCQWLPRIVSKPEEDGKITLKTVKKPARKCIFRRLNRDSEFRRSIWTSKEENQYSTFVVNKHFKVWFKDSFSNSLIVGSLYILFKLFYCARYFI